ncbi:unnamed protein product [Spodoptera littoralis]|uniref:Uncharacterized protein n=1 Tax=Spodoptera littoralis TaxID=7109 RepID=A0A9P0MWJ7_SPOLI|nr:unnamed protein product [Spodoptera littoralis]CAH1636018.1 unnamed protein product [Spodoptera littoralis]
MANKKFLLSRIVVYAVAFLSLCAAAENHRCYWCGPLAEQVHRSQRALPCSGGQMQVTVCDPGYQYCAVVATSPPYKESRYCVKLYQDECYALYCNSTKTWRMTCPCLGDLCNGPNTERELEAFAGLAKIVSKTHNTRLRRALVTTGRFISLNPRRNRIDNATAEAVEEIEKDLNATNVNIDLDTESHDDNVANIVTEAKSEEQVVETTQVSTELQNSEASNNPSEMMIEPTNVNTQMNDSVIQVDIPSENMETSNLKTEIILLNNETDKDVAKPNENVPEVQTTLEVTTQTTVETKVMTETNAMTEPTPEVVKTAPTEAKFNNLKPSEQLPTAEAFQFTDAATTKTTESVMLTSTTQTTMPLKNNTATRFDAHILTLAVGVVLNYNL